MLTDRSRDTYDFIVGYVTAHGFAPKLREIAEHLGINSRGTVHRYLQTLIEAGLIEIEPDRARGIRLTDVAAGQDDTGTSLPMLGRIAAGRPIEAIPGHDSIDLGQFFVGPGRFVLRVQGDSMIEDGILDGDMVIVQQRDNADDNEEATLKRLQRNRDGSVTLIPANASLAPMRYSGERVRIQGVVVGQFRAY